MTIETRFRRHIYFFLFMLIIFAADQITKYLVVRNIALGAKTAVIKGFLSLVYSRNTGGAFSLFPDKPMLFLALSVGALVLLLYLYFKLEGKFWPTLSAVAIMGGALGNLTDRLQYGQVVDFIDVYWGNWHWYIFNVADAAISLGAAGLFVTTAISEIVDWRRRKREAADVQTPGEAAGEAEGNKERVSGKPTAPF
jgi:signal peptidase II